MCRKEQELGEEEAFLFCCRRHFAPSRSRAKGLLDLLVDRVHRRGRIQICNQVARLVEIDHGRGLLVKAVKAELHGLRCIIFPLNKRLASQLGVWFLEERSGRDEQGGLQMQNRG